MVRLATCKKFYRSIRGSAIRDFINDNIDSSVSRYTNLQERTETSAQL